MSRDLQWRLAGSGKPVPSPLVRLVIFLAQVNLHVWYLKDPMKEEPQRYGDLLAFAQDLNSLRNVCRNTIMDLLGEGNLSQHHTFFFRDEGGAWYRPLIQWMGLLRNSTVISLSPEEFAGMFGIPPEEFDNTWKARVRDAGLRYQRLTPDYRDHIIRRIIHRIDSDQMWVSGPDKVGVWEKGWKENLLEYQKTGDLNALTPKFVQSAPVLRLGGDYIKPLNPDFEFVAVDIFRRWLFKRFLSEASAIYEFGCGSCQHLPVLAEMFPGRTLYALDWAASSCDIAEALATAHGWKIKGIRFNLFAPDTHLEMEPNTAVLTVGALEQLGENFEPFLNFLLKQRPRMVVHVETLQELYDSEKLSDYLALKHDTKRNYLHGYLTALRRLAGEGRVQLLRVQRSSFGSMYHDSYSSVAWRPS
ncbi:MAG TPA: class I SAM-dependent methyltransferase [Kiritimatiellia bacterium]|nr:class I SAM-dependent methyltransferase [Kiritimatiellia bacterium]